MNRSSQSTRNKPRPASKAVYRGQSSAQPSQKGVGLSQAARRLQQSLPTLAETNDDTVSSIVPRNVYQPSDGAVLSSVARLEEYLQETEIENVFHKLCHYLLSLPDLPYNPYPGFVARVRQHAEKFHMNFKQDEIFKKIISVVESSHIGYLVKQPDCSYIWGLESVVRYTDSHSLIQFQSLLQSLTPERNTLVAHENYSNQATPVLAGSAVFNGTFYVRYSEVKVKLEYLITGADPSKGIELFVDSIISHIKHLNAAGIHIFLDLTASDYSWTIADIEQSQDEVIEVLKEAVVDQESITAQCIFSLNEMEHKKGVVVYSLHFIKLAQSGQAESLVTFTNTPMMTLHEGVFLQQHHAESYLSVFTPRLDLLDLDKADKEMKAALGKKGNVFRFKWMKGRAKKFNKVKIDGFKIMESTALGPTHAQIIQPIVEDIKIQILQLHPQAQCFEIIHLVLLLTIIDRENFGDNYQTEVYKLLHCRAARMHDIMCQNKILRQLVQRFIQDEYSPMVDDLYLKYKADIMDLLGEQFQERSSDMETACRSLLGMLGDLIEVGEEDMTNHVVLSDKTVLHLKEINFYCAAIFLSLVEDALAWCPNIQKLTEELKKEFPDAAPRPGTREKEIRTLKPKKVKQKEKADYIHGVEDKTIMRHSRQVLNIRMAIQKDSSPKLVSVESVLMKYMIDTRLDQVWSEYMADLLLKATLPPNPYPSLVSELRKSAFKMDLCYEPDEKLLEKLFHGTSQVEVPKNFIWHIPGCDAHGLQSALAVIDTSNFFQLAPLVQNFVNSKFKQRSGAYRVAICLAVSGHSPLYGRMSPYLNSIELHENCFIRGPSGCASNARQLYSSIIFHHMWDLFRTGNYPIFGVFMGKEELRWPLNDIAEHRKAFASQFEQYCAEKKPLYLKAYMKLDWRYVPVIKYFRLHFINEEETEYERFFPYDPSSLYQNVFFNSEKASFHFQYGGTPSKDDPFNSGNKQEACRHLDRVILQAVDSQNWLDVHRWLLTRNLINQGTAHVGETWRMLHSVAGQLEYARLLCKSLQDLIAYSMEIEIRDEKEHNKPHDMTETEPSIAGTDLEELPDKISNLNMTVLCGMLEAVKQKLNEVCKQPTAMAAVSVAAIIEMRIQEVTERDPHTNQLYPILMPETISTFVEIQGMLKALEDTCAADVHAGCPAAQAVVRSIQAEYTTRPASVESLHLDDPSVYLTRPAATKDYLEGTD